MQASLSNWLLVAILVTLVAAFVYPVTVKKKCLREARDTSNMVAASEQRLASETTLEFVRTDYDEARNNIYTQCLAEHGL